MYKLSMYNIELKKEKNKVLLFNTVTGAMVWIRDDYICNRNYEDDKVLYNAGILVDLNVNEFLSLKEEREQQIFSSEPIKLKLVIAPTLRCNLSCVYCFEDDGRSKNVDIDYNTIISLSEFIIKYIKRYPSIKKLIITWFGGEPTICSNQIYEFNRLFNPLCKDLGILYEARIVTNGLLLSKDVVDSYYIDCNMRYAQITVDGDVIDYCRLKRCKESEYYKVIENIVYATQKLKVDLRVNVDKRNAYGIHNLLDLLLNRYNLNGQINIGFAPIHKWNKFDGDYMDDDSYLIFLRSIHSYILEKGYQKSVFPRRPLRKYVPCGLMKEKNFSVGPDGKIYRCEHTIGMLGYEIGKIDSEEKFNDISKKFLTYELLKRCETCKIFPLCMGGCPADKILYGKETDNCDSRIKFILEQLDFAYKVKGGE